MKVWTKAEIKNLMETNDKVLCTALVKIYNCQTEYERACGDTVENNGVGFNGCDAEILSSFARFYNQNGFLTPKQKNLARKKMMKYAGQVTKLANEHERLKEETA